jgi:mannose-6-phosphate isomerase-like protein (cupin superfamily)
MDESAGQEAERRTASGVIILGPGEGRIIPGTDAITLIATSEQTGGSIGVFEDISSPGDGPPRHVHYGSDELFYVLEGEFLILVGERQESVSAGTYVFVPRGTVHAYKVIGTERGTVLSAFIPGGPELAFEEFVKLRTEGEEVNRSVRRSRTVAQMNKTFAEINEKYDSEFAGPPL